jgi:peroxiredoxin
MKGFQELLGDLEALGARVAGVSADTYAALGAFAEQAGVTFPLLSDWPDLKTIDTFGVRNESRPTARRATFIFDAAAVLQAVVDDQGDMNAHSLGALKVLRDLAAKT